MADFLVADIGGTNARFAVSNQAGALRHIDRLPTADYAHLEDAIRAYMQRHQITVSQAAIAIANPVIGDQIQMTNHHWSFSITALQQRLQWSRLKVLNDLTAQAFALPVLQPCDVRCIQAGQNDGDGVRMVMGAGTGLGVSALIPVAGGRWTALSGEGGHVDASAANDDEWQMIEYARRFYPEHVSAERLLCGHGLSLIDAALRRLPDLTHAANPAEITRAALQGDAHSVRVVRQYLAMLAGAAADAALTIGAWGGVYLCGGVLPKIATLLDERDFVARFTAKGRLAHCLQQIPIYVVLDDQQSGLKGAAQALLLE